MFNHYCTLRLVAERMDRSCRGAVIRDIFSQERNIVVFQCERDGMPVCFQFSADGRLFHLLLRPEYHRARRNSVDLFPAAVGTRIESVAIEPGDRIITILLLDGSLLRALLLPGKANILHCSPDGIPVQSFKRYVPDRPEEMPPGGGGLSELLEAEDDALRRTIESGVTPDRCFAPLGRTLLEELLHRAGVPSGEAGPASRAAAFVDAFRDLRRDLASPVPRIYFSGETAEIFSIIPLRSRDRLREEQYPDIHEALFRFLRKRSGSATFHQQQRNLSAALQRGWRHLSVLKDALRSEEEIHARALQYEKFGALLMAAPADTIVEGEQLSLPDLFDNPDLPVAIPIDPMMNMVENAGRYYAKAKHAKSSIEHVRRRRALLARKLDETRRAIDELDRCFDSSSLKHYISLHKQLLQSMGISEKGEKDSRPFPYRRFAVAGGLEVWAGKNSANNDELTQLGAEKNDLWFHARGVGGSHVVLKTGGKGAQAPKEAIEEAASIAAYYSKARKARSVAVAYTEKKHVRKPKGAPPGTVIMEREKVIMAEPRLPSRTADDDTQGEFE